MTALFAVTGGKAQSSPLSCVSCSKFAGITPDVTPRQDHLSGVIICPVVRRGQRLTGKCNLASLRGELHHRYHCFYYTGVCISVSSDQHARGPSDVINIRPEPTARSLDDAGCPIHDSCLCCHGWESTETHPYPPSCASHFEGLCHPALSTAIRKQTKAAVSDATLQRAGTHLRMGKNAH